jgi:hypothetical protein
MHCLAPLTVVANHRYRTVIKTDHVANGKQWWRASVSDVTAGTTVRLGTIEEPYAYMAKMPQSFLEYWGPDVTCSQTPFVTATYDAPVVTPSGTTTRRSGSFEGGSEGSCPSSTFAPTETGASVTTGGPQPFMPFLFESVVSKQRVKVQWLITSDGGSRVHREDIQISTSPGHWSFIAKAGPVATSKKIQLSPGSYSFRIAAVNASGRGAWSDPSPIVTIASPT